MGQHSRLGAVLDARGVTFAVYSSVASAVQLCLFDNHGNESRLEMASEGDGIWSVRVDGIEAGQLYGFRVRGDYRPAQNLRCNPAKLLIDPYARAVSGELRWDPAVFGYVPGGADADLRESQSDSAPFVPRSVVVDPAFDWEDDQPPETPLADSVVYEVHVRGFTMRHPEVPPEIRGAYSGLADPAVIDYLTGLGVTAIELMPVQHFVDEQNLVQPPRAGRRDYWGYNPLAPFAPTHRYSSSGDLGGQVQEFKRMVKALHAAGIEVILDLVFNHTCEGNEMGPTLSLKGFDSPAYYRTAADPRHLFDVTGTGNSVDMTSGPAIQLSIDCLRYWAEEMHVDGFRFDEATELGDTMPGRDDSFSADAPFFRAVATDRVLSRLKLIAEPWDSYEWDQGRYPRPWSEWNGRFRDSVRAYWQSWEGMLSALAYAVTGSSDLFDHDSRLPTASVNYVASHDGYTLRDLVSTTDRGQRAWDCGGDPVLRFREQCDYLATCLLAQGVPMILSGDECGRTQGLNSNAYDQDDPTTWFDWAGADQQLLAFTRAMIDFRLAHPIFRGGHWLRDGVEAAWFRPDGQPMTAADWSLPWARSVQLLYREMPGGPDGGPPDGPFLLLFNAHWEPVSFMPASPPAGGWQVLIDASQALVSAGGSQSAPNPLSVPGRTLIVLGAV